MLADKIEIMKCQANKKGNNFLIKGNNLANKGVKQASRCKTAVLALMVSVEPMTSIEGLELHVRATVKKIT